MQVRQSSCKGVLTETDVKINVIAQVTPDILDDYRKMGDYYDKLAAEAMSLVSDKA
mgnify:CR=1 FL=1